MKPLIVAFLGGLALLLGVRLSWPELGGAIAAALLAVGVVAWLGFYYHGDRERDRGRSGDDLYYLGLLFTLCSLIYTLVALFLTDAGGTPQRIEQLIGNFGIALVSTVAGILGRILLQSDAAGTAEGDAGEERQQAFSPTSGSDRTPADEYDLAAKDAVQSMLALRRDLREASDAFAHFTRVTLSQGEHAKARTERLIEDFNRRIEESAERHLAGTATAWQETAAAMTAAAERLLTRIDEHTANAARRTETAWEEVARKAETTAAAASKRLDEDAEQMAALLHYLATANRALEALGTDVATVRGNVAELGDEAARAASQVGEQSAATTRAQNAFAEAANGARATTAQALAETAENIAKLRDSLGEQVRLGHSAVENFAAAAAAERERQQQVATAAGTSLDELAARIANMDDDFASFRETMKTAADGFAATVGEVADHLDRLAVRRSRRSIFRRIWQLFGLEGLLGPPKQRPAQPERKRR